MKNSISVVFMGTPDFAVPTLRALLEDETFSVRAVVTQPDRPRGRGKKLSMSPVKELAVREGVPTLQPEKAREPEVAEAIARLEPDYLVVVAYGQILPVSILEIPRLLPVNLHASLLPRWRGAAPIHRAFLEGDSVTGVCSMIMEAGLDTGDTLMCAKTTIEELDTVGSLHDRLSQMGAGLMVETLLRYRDGALAPEKQNDDEATYAKKLEKEDFVVDWSKSSEAVSRQIRGLSPYPGAVTSLNELIIKPMFAQVENENTDKEPGVVVKLNERGVEVACSRGTVVISELKPEGKGRMSAHSFTLGHSVKVGDRFR